MGLEKLRYVPRTHCNSWPNFVTFDRFFKTEKKFWRLGKNSYVFAKIDKSSLAKKKLGYRFFCWTIFSSLICLYLFRIINKSNQSSYHLPNGWFFHIFIPLGNIRNTPWISLFAGNLRMLSYGRARFGSLFQIFFITKYNTIVSIFLYVFIGIINYK